MPLSSALTSSLHLPFKTQLRLSNSGKPSLMPPAFLGCLPGRAGSSLSPPTAIMCFQLLSMSVSLHSPHRLAIYLFMSISPFLDSSPYRKDHVFFILLSLPPGTQQGLGQQGECWNEDSSVTASSCSLHTPHPSSNRSCV